MRRVALLSGLAVASASTTTCWKDGKTAPCGPGNDQCGPPQDPNARPKFHVKDLTCDENDPNFPFYDEVHGMYHLMYQDHVCIAPGHGPDIGHVVSRDFVHWAHLPVSIWNDKPYDNEAIFTGSASVIDGKPFIVYPGLCNKKDYPPSTDGGARNGCITGTNYAQAVPANLSDPLYTNWTKDKSAGVDIATNPIVNGTSDDPSTAWKTPHGEWRLIGNAKAYGQNKSGVAPIYAAKEFTGEWHLVGDTPLPSGECPSFFELPALYPGTSKPTGAQLPTHVHKRGHGSPGCNGDCMTLGTWVDGAPGEIGTWTATPGVPFDEVLIDHGAYYASKDFYDAPNKRRINWGWATIPGGSQSMARVVTYHTTLKQLVYSPAPEYDKLHGASLAKLGPTPLSANKPLSLGSWEAGAGNSSDILVSFSRPTSACKLGVSVLSGAMTVFINWPSTATTEEEKEGAVVTKVQVGIMQGTPDFAPPPPVGTILNGTCGATNFGGDCNVQPSGAWNAKAEKITTLEQCVAKAKACKMANFVSFSNVPGNSDCSWYQSCNTGQLCEDCHTCGIGCPNYQTEVVKTPPEPATATAGSLSRQQRLAAADGTQGDMSDTLQLLPTDSEITLRVFVDRTLVEAYWMDGRVAMTSATPHAHVGATPSAAQAEVFSTGAGVKLQAAHAFEMESIWVSTDEVLATPRLH